MPSSQEFNAFQQGFLACLKQFKIPWDDATVKKTREIVTKYAKEPEYFEKLDPREFDGSHRHEGTEASCIHETENR